MISKRRLPAKAASFFQTSPKTKLFLIFEKKEDETLASIIIGSTDNSL